MSDELDLRKVLAEVAGTFIFFFMGIGSVALFPGNLLLIALGHGLGLAIAIFALGRISGGHYNPAVTIAVIVARKMNLLLGALYIAGQIAGGILACLLLWLLVSESQRPGLGTPLFSDSLGWLPALLIELAATFVFVLVILISTNNSQTASFAGAIIGATLFGAILITGNLTGGILNPARAFTPALVFGPLDGRNLVYWFGPIAGGLLAAFVYMMFFSRRVSLEEQLATSTPADAVSAGTTPATIPTYATPVKSGGTSSASSAGSISDVNSKVSVGGVTPIVDTPGVSTSMGSVPSVAMPSVAAHDINVPISTASPPAMEAPRIDVPDMPTPGMSTPSASRLDVSTAMAKVDMSNTSMPDVAAPAPEVDMPNADMPGMSAPNAGMSAAPAPRMDMPDIYVPGLAMPDVPEHGVSASTPDMPDAPDMPDVPNMLGMPGVETPDASIAEASVTEITVPYTSMPDVSVTPDISAPETPAHSMSMHDVITSDLKTSDAEAPELAAHEPGVNTLDISEHDVPASMPDVSMPGMPMPAQGASTPDVDVSASEPDMLGRDVELPSVGAPMPSAAATAAAAIPEVAEPAASMPDIIVPDIIVDEEAHGTPAIYVEYGASASSVSIHSAPEDIAKDTAKDTPEDMAEGAAASSGGQMDVHTPTVRAATSTGSTGPLPAEPSISAPASLHEAGMAGHESKNEMASMGMVEEEGANTGAGLDTSASTNMGTSADMGTAAGRHEPTGAHYPRKAETRGPIGIADVQYAADEYVVVKNSGSTEADVGGYVLMDRNDKNQKYRFADGTHIPAAGVAQVYSRPGHAYSFNSKRPIWNDHGDELELLDAGGDVVSYFTYGKYLTGTRIGAETGTKAAPKPAHEAHESTDSTATKSSAPDTSATASTTPTTPTSTSHTAPAPSMTQAPDAHITSQLDETEQGGA